MIGRFLGRISSQFRVEPYAARIQVGGSIKLLRHAGRIHMTNDVHYMMGVYSSYNPSPVVQ